MPALGEYRPLSIQYLDYSGERKSVTVNSKSWDEDTVVQYWTDIAAFWTALDAVTLGTRAKDQYAVEMVRSNTRPNDKTAQIETELLVTYIDATTEEPFSFRIPTADYEVFNYASPPAGDEVIIAGAGASAATTALITAMGAVVRSPAGNSITVTGMRVVR